MTKHESDSPACEKNNFIYLFNPPWNLLQEIGGGGSRNNHFVLHILGGSWLCCVPGGRADFLETLGLGGLVSSSGFSDLGA
jgi:hypothetical protein